MHYLSFNMQFMNLKLNWMGHRIWIFHRYYNSHSICIESGKIRNVRNLPAGELILGLSTGLADTGECDRGEVVKLWWPPSDSRWMATAALLDGNVGPTPLKLPTERFVEDKSTEAAAAVECDVIAFSRCDKMKIQLFFVFRIDSKAHTRKTYSSWRKRWSRFTQLRITDSYQVW